MNERKANYRALFRLCLCALICVWIGGCGATGRVPAKGYFGPTDPIDKVLNDINENARRIPTLRGTGSFQATIVEQGKSHFINGQVTLLFSRPDSLRLIGKKDIAGGVFDLGCNDERYWLIVRGQQSTMWTGQRKNLDRLSPEKIPVRPDLVMEVLGIQTISMDLLQPPVPVMRFNNDADAYMLVWNQKLQDRWVAQKEIWYDRASKLPRLVILFDQTGRVVLRAYLSNHKQPDQASAAMVATTYRLFFPDSGSKISIDLDDIALKRNNAPNQRSFVFPGENAGVDRVIQLDE